MKRTSVLVLLLWTLVVLGQNKPSAPEYEISGVVVDSATQQPLGQTRVAIIAVSGGQEVQNCLTAEDGRFHFAKVQPGKYQLIAERMGYHRQALDQHEEFSSAVAVGENRDSTHLIFRLRAGATIAGTVADEYSEPVRNASVDLFRRSVENGELQTRLFRHVQTDEDGAYHFGGLMPGRYFVVVMARPWFALEVAQRGLGVTQAGSLVSGRTQGAAQADGDNGGENQFNVAYPTTYYSDATDSAAATPINLHSGERFEADVTLRAETALRVKIVPPQTMEGQNASHPRQVVMRNIPHVALWQRLFADVEQPAEGQMTMWGATGEEINGVAPGRYILHVQENGQPDRTQPIVIAGDITIDPAALKGEAAASVSGKVISSAGDRIAPEGLVRLESPGSPHNYAARVSADGEFKLNDVEPGTYNVFVANMEGRYVQRVSATDAKARGRSITIAPGADVKLSVFAGKGLGKIDGTAMQGDKPQAGVMILTVPDGDSADPALARRDQSDSDGTFTLATLAPGDYTVMAIADGWDLEWTNAASLKPYLAKGVRVRVQPGGKYDVRPQVQPLLP